jgi:hypothetical protein
MNKQEALEKIKELQAYIKQCDKEQGNGTGVFVCNDPAKTMWIVEQGGEGKWQTINVDGSAYEADYPAFRTKEHAEAWAEFNETMMMLRNQPGAGLGEVKNAVWGTCRAGHNIRFCCFPDEASFISARSAVTQERLNRAADILMCGGLQ